MFGLVNCGIAACVINEIYIVWFVRFEAYLIIYRLLCFSHTYVQAIVKSLFHIYTGLYCLYMSFFCDFAM